MRRRDDRRDIRKRAFRITQGFIACVRDQLHLLGKTQSWLADQAGVRRASVSLHLSGRNPITMTTMAKYEKALGIQWFILSYSPSRVRAQVRQVQARRRRRSSG